MIKGQNHTLIHPGGCDIARIPESPHQPRYGPFQFLIGRETVGVRFRNGKSVQMTIIEQYSGERATASHRKQSNGPRRDGLSDCLKDRLRIECFPRFLFRDRLSDHIASSHSLFAEITRHAGVVRPWYCVRGANPRI